MYKYLDTKKRRNSTQKNSQNNNIFFQKTNGAKIQKLCQNLRIT